MSWKKGDFPVSILRVKAVKVSITGNPPKRINIAISLEKLTPSIFGSAIVIKCEANKYPSNVLPPSPKNVCAAGKFQHNIPSAIAPINIPEYERPRRNNATDDAINIDIHNPFMPSMRLYALVTPASQIIAIMLRNGESLRGITITEAAIM